MSTTLALRQKRAKVITDAGAILSKAHAEKRAPTAEERRQWDRLHAEAGTLKGLIEEQESAERAGRQADEERAIAEREGRQTTPKGGDGTDHGTARERRMAFRAWALQEAAPEKVSEEARNAAKKSGLDLRQKQLTLYRPEQERAYRTAREVRALSVGTTTAGGFGVADYPMRPLEEARLEYGAMYSVATVIRTETGADMPFPMVNDTAQKGAILAENTQVAEQDIAFTQMVLQAFKYSSKLVRVSVELMQDASFDVGSFVGRALGTRIGRILNDHFTTGTGSGQPNGVLTAATAGVTAAAAAAISFVDLIKLVHSVDPAYRANSRFMFHDNVLSAIQQLVDTTGRPLWQPAVGAGFQDGEADRIWGYPYTINQSMTSTIATTNKTVLFGDFSYYYIRETRDVTLLRLEERYADFHQVGFIAFSRHDGDLLNAGTNPIKYLTQA